MGEAKRRISATQALIQKFPDCCLCGGIRRSTTREHMPPKALFDGSHRPDKLVIPACSECNKGTSTADLTASVIARWRYDIGEQEHEDHRRLIAQVRRQAPELIKEWTESLDRAKAREHLEEYGIPVPVDAGFATIGPMTIRQLNLFAHKAVLGLYFEHFQKLLTNEGRVSAFWRSKEDFAKDGIPPALLEIMKKYGTLEQGKWNTREIFEYRYDTNQNDGLFACLARLRGGLFVTGFAVANVESVAELSDWQWIKPADLLGKLDDPAFRHRQ